GEVVHPPVAADSLALHGEPACAVEPAGAVAAAETGRAYEAAAEPALGCGVVLRDQDAGKPAWPRDLRHRRRVARRRAAGGGRAGPGEGGEDRQPACSPYERPSSSIRAVLAHSRSCTYTWIALNAAAVCLASPRTSRTPPSTSWAPNAERASQRSRARCALAASTVRIRIVGHWRYRP